MQAIAARFPGALREREWLSRAEIARRRRDAQAARDRTQSGNPDEPVPTWLRLSLRVHEALLQALAAKRLLAGRAVTDALAHHAWRAFGIERSRLERIASPPRGRISELVHRDVAHAAGITVDTLRAHLFPAGPRPASEDEP